MDYKYYFFKFNLPEKTISTYISFEDNINLTSAEEMKKHMLEEIIPRNLSLVYELEKSDNFNKYKINIVKLNTEEFFNDLEKLRQNTLILEEMYGKVLSDYLDNGSIIYTKEFLEQNEICKTQRRFFQNKYPIVKEGLNRLTDQEVQKLFSVQFDNQIGTGIKHIKSFYRIDNYVEYMKAEGILDNSEIEVFYDADTEHIVVKSKNEIEAYNSVKAIEKVLNSSESFVKELGKININPIYESIEFTKSFSSIEFTLVYPNWKAVDERYEAIMADTKADEQKVKLSAENEYTMNVEYILGVLNEQAKKGYLKDVTKSITKKIISSSSNYLF